MTESEIVKELRSLLSNQLEWYRECKAQEERGEIDSSYIYDTADEVFMEMPKGNLEYILKILA